MAFVCLFYYRDTADRFKKKIKNKKRPTRLRTANRVL